MGNKLCKKKPDLGGGVDCPNKPSPTPFDRIINRLHLRPNSWKSESHLNQKQVNRSLEKDSKSKSGKLLSKSTDWTDASLEVPEKDEAIHLENPKLSLIFDNEKSTPVPPPRKHKRGFREKLEAVAKSGLQAFQSNNNNSINYANKKPVEEPLCVKKMVNPSCPLDDHDCAIHNRNHKHEQKKNEINENKSKTSNKRKKNLSVVSLPNYNELKLTVATFDDIDKKPSGTERHNSAHENASSASSLPDGNAGGKKLTTAASSAGKLETCMTRCRSFGSLLPQQLLDKWRVRKIPTDNIESDDSFGGLEDWDLRIIEHYNPKDASLPRPRKNNKEVKLTDLESLIVNDEEAERPIAPIRRSESLVKKINREAAKSAVNTKRSQNDNIKISSSVGLTPPPSPEKNKQKTSPQTRTEAPEEESNDHSSLMKILEKYSIMDKLQNVSITDETFPDLAGDGEIKANNSVKLEKEIASIQDFLKNEKLNISKDVAPPVAKFGTVGLAQAKV